MSISVTLKKIMISCLSSISLTAFGLSDPSQEIRIYSQSGYIAYASVDSVNGIEYHKCDRSFGGSYLWASQTKTFKIDDPNPRQKKTYKVLIQGLDVFGWTTFHYISVTKLELPVCIIISGSLLNPSYEKVNCDTWS